MQPRPIRNRRPVVTAGPLGRAPTPGVVRPYPIITASADADEAPAAPPRPAFVACGPRANLHATVRPVAVVVAAPRDEPALPADTPRITRPTLRWQPAAPVTHSHGARQAEDALAREYAAQQSAPGRTVTPTSTPRPYTTVAPQPAPPPPPDVVVCQLQGPRRLAPALVSRRPVQPLIVQPIEATADAPPQALGTPRERRPARPLQPVQCRPQDFLFEDTPPGVTRGVRRRPNPTAVVAAPTWGSDVVEAPPPQVLVRQVVRPWVPLPRPPLGGPQEVPGEADVPPRSLAVPRERRPARPLQQVQALAAPLLPHDEFPAQVLTLRGGYKVPPRVPLPALAYPHEALGLAPAGARVYATFGVNSVIPTPAGRVVALAFWDTTAKALWSVDGTATGLSFTDTTAYSFDSVG